ncbi:MAG: flagellar basal body rod protein FlgC [Planctomycetota bacterium]|jgi:flagellar basal-body rod protein FlgC
MNDITGSMKGIFHGFDIASSGLRAEMQRSEIVAVNLSNMNSIGNEVDKPYQRRGVIFEEVLGDTANSSLRGIAGSEDLATGVRVSEIYADGQTPFEAVHAPYHPKANAAGYVLRSNVDMFKELVDMSIIDRSFQANLQALRSYRSMLQSAVQNIGR